MKKDGTNISPKYRYKLNLEEITLNLPNEQRAQTREVITFLRRNRKIEKIQSELDAGMDHHAEEDLLDENEVVDGDLEEDELEFGGDDTLVESFWNYLVGEEARKKQEEKRLERLQYRDQLTKDMNQEEYLYYSECTKVSFTRPNRKGKFTAWCKLDTFPITLSNECVEVLGQLAYTYLEDIVRQSLLLRKDKSKGLRIKEVIQHLQKKLALLEKQLPPSSLAANLKSVQNPIQSSPQTSENLPKPFIESTQPSQE